MIFNNKRGQVTTYVIIAIVIVALGILASVFWPQVSGFFTSEDQARAILASQSDSLRKAVSDCVETTSKDIITRQGLQAGYYDYSHLYSIEFAGPKVVVMTKNINKERINNMPSITKIEQEFNKAMQEEGYERIDACLNNFASFRSIDVEPRERNIGLKIEDEIVIVSVDWPMTLSKPTMTGTVSQNINQNSVNILIPLGRAWKVANDIVTMEVQQKDVTNEIDYYILSNVYRLQYTRLNSQNYPNDRKTIYFINTIPYRAGEQQLNFYFAVDREEYTFI